MELGWVEDVHCCQELLPISSSASAPAAETSTSKDARGVGMPCLCELFSLPFSLGFAFFFFFWDPISVWTSWNYFFKKHKSCSWFRLPSKTDMNNSAWKTVPRGRSA